MYARRLVLIPVPRFSSMNGALIDLLERIGSRQYLYFIEGLCAVQALPVVDGPVFKFHFKAVIVFLKQVRPAAKRAHDRVHFVKPPVSFPLAANDGPGMENDFLAFPHLQTSLSGLRTWWSGTKNMLFDKRKTAVFSGAFLILLYHRHRLFAKEILAGVNPLITDNGIRVCPRGERGLRPINCT